VMTCSCMRGARCRGEFAADDCVEDPLLIGLGGPDTKSPALPAAMLPRWLPRPNPNVDARRYCCCGDVLVEGASESAGVEKTEPRLLMIDGRVKISGASADRGFACVRW